MASKRRRLPRGISGHYGGRGYATVPPVPKLTPYKTPDTPNPVVTHTTGGGGPHYPGYLTPAQIRAAALNDAKLGYGMQEAELRRAQAEASKRAMAQAQAIQGFSGAAAKIMSGAGAETFANYQGAARDTSTFAKGFSDATRQIAETSAGEQNQRLAALGNTSQTVHGDQGAANVLYGLGGYIPATTLEREGAAYAGAAAAYPRAVLGEGAIGFRHALAEGERSATEYGAKLTDLARAKGLSVSQYIRQARREQAGLKGQAYAQKMSDLKWQAQQASQARRDEFTAGYLANQTARDQQSKDSAQSQMTGYVIVNGKVVKDKNGNPIPTASQAAKIATETRLARASEAGITGTDPVTNAPTYKAKNDATNRAARAEAARIKAATAAANKKTNRTNSVANRSKAVESAHKTAATLAQDAASDYVINPQWKEGSILREKYIDYRTGKPTNNTQFARRKADYRTVFNLIWNAVDAPTLIARYGIQKKQLSAEINQIMRRSGYKPRPKAKPKSKKNPLPNFRPHL